MIEQAAVIAIRSVYIVTVKLIELLRLLEQDGWYSVRQSGSHRIYRHLEKTGQLTVPVHGAKEVPTGTLTRILKDAGLK